MLTYQAKLVGIRMMVTEESYTSKCSLLDLEPVGKQKEYAGKRIKRGLFRASDGKHINADVNASGNIISKVVPNAFADGIEDFAVRPFEITSPKWPGTFFYVFSNTLKQTSEVRNTIKFA